MVIENIRRFYCPRCGYMTEDEQQVRLIEEVSKGRCPACSGGPRIWEKSGKIRRSTNPRR